MSQIRTTAIDIAMAAAMLAMPFSAVGGQAFRYPLPLKYSGPATVPAITAGDLMTRLYQYADDSMMGRRVGTIGNDMATSYVASEARRLGLSPAGENGGFFQDIGVVVRTLDSTSSSFTAGGTTYYAGVDFIATTSGTMHNVQNAPLLVWGSQFDTLNQPTPEQYRGRIVYVRGVPVPEGVDMQRFMKTAGYQRFATMQNSPDVAGFLVLLPVDHLSASYNDQVFRSIGSFIPATTAGAIRIAARAPVVDALIGRPAASAAPGTVGQAITTSLHWSDIHRGGRNVIAILPGTDTRLRGEYVAIGAHTDHLGYRPSLVGETDSLEVWGRVAHPSGTDDGRDLEKDPITAGEWTKINAEIAALRKIYPARPDSIYNGADDDGSGTVSLLEIAEAFAKGTAKPKRSVLFVWHAGEERGMWGSSYFMDHPTVARDSIVAQLNIDMIGRGDASDVTGRATDGTPLHGNPDYLQLIGSRRLSTELGDLVESTNTKYKLGMKFDYSLDAEGHAQSMYCRSDHWSYAKWGVPIVYFTTGGHADYHEVTDEPQYIRYEHMARVDHLIFDLAEEIANLDHRIVVDHPKPSPAPAMACKQ